MNNHSLCFILKTRFVSLGNRIFLPSFLFYTLAVLIFTNSAFSQTVKWRYIATLGINASKVYLNDEIKVLKNKNVTVWQKLILANGLYAISQEELDCKNKRIVTRQITYYRIDQTVDSTKKKPFEWEEIIPSSTGDFIYSRVCLPPQLVKWAQIGVQQAYLRNFPNPSAPVIRTARRGERFQIIPETGKDGWFNIVDAATQEDYWLRDNAFEIVVLIEINPMVMRNEKPQFKPAKQKSKSKRVKNQSNRKMNEKNERKK